MTAAGVRPAILFAAGRGGSPARHTVLLDTLRNRGFAVTAPEAPMLEEPRPTEAELAARVGGLSDALSALPGEGPVTGIGHSIGATLLAAMAGATLWLSPGRPLAIRREARLARIVMLAPPVGLFAAPGATDGLIVPVMLRSGGADALTPPESHRGFAARLTGPVDHAVEPEAGHFSFMDISPPGQMPAFHGEAAFRVRLYEEIVAFAIR